MAMTTSREAGGRGFLLQCSEKHVIAGPERAMLRRSVWR
jgi:hypothetical protein